MVVEGMCDISVPSSQFFYEPKTALQKSPTQDFPGGSVVVKESACQCKGHRLDPRSGKIPHAAKQLIPCTTPTEPVLYSPRTTTTEPMCHDYWSPCVTTSEARVPRAHAPQQEEPPQ